MSRWHIIINNDLAHWLWQKGHVAKCPGMVESARRCPSVPESAAAMSILDNNWEPLPPSPSQHYCYNISMAGNVCMYLGDQEWHWSWDEVQFAPPHTSRRSPSHVDWPPNISVMLNVDHVTNSVTVSLCHLVGSLAGGGTGWRGRGRRQAQPL